MAEAPATARPPDPDVAAVGERSGGAIDPSAADRSSRWQDAVAVVALAGLAVVAGLVFIRILPAAALAGRLVIAGVVATAVAWVCRRRAPDRLGISLGASLVAYVVTTGVLLFRSDTVAGLPTPSSTHAIVDALANGSARILTSALPTPPVPSALIIPVTVTWLVAWAGHELAGRVRAPLLPVLPALVGFGFGLLFGGTDAALGVTAAFVALAATVGVVRALPSGGSTRARLGRLIGLGLPLVVVLALVAWGVGAALGVSSDQIDLHDPHVAAKTFSPAITPLSQIQEQLLDQPPIDLFRVTVPAGATDLLPNWRLTVLDHFDGSLWSTPETFVPAGGTLPPGEGTDATTTQVTEQVTVDHLGGVWLPTAGQATHTSLDLVDVGTDSGSLALAGGLAPGLSYRVVATVAQYPASALAHATPQGGGDDTALPSTAPSDLALIRSFAATVTRRGTTPAAKLTLLETYLRSSRFTSTPEADAGQSYARVADLLHGHHSGTSEQFATAFALMARTLGYPARVAVGFRRGTATGGRFTVTSLDAYAWPEVHFANLGWVPYDPTPDPSGAAAPGAAVVPVTTPGPASGDATQLVPQTGATGTSSAPGAGGADLGQLVALAIVLLVLGALVAVPLLVLARHRRRERRRRQAPDPDDRVVGAWLEAVEQMRVASVALPANLTNTEVVATASVHLGPDVAGAMGSLRTLVDQAVFAVEPATAAQADQAWAAADQVIDRVRDGLGWWPRLVAAVDPRPLWPRWSVSR